MVAYQEGRYNIDTLKQKREIEKAKFLKEITALIVDRITKVGYVSLPKSKVTNVFRQRTVLGERLEKVVEKEMTVASLHRHEIFRQ